MTTILSTSTAITVKASGSSELGALALSMAPGTWAKLAAVGQDAALGVGNVSGTMIHYCNSMPWNPVTKRIEFIGCDHMYGSMRHVQYNDATNAFSLASDNATAEANYTHGYDHNSLNPHTGDLYRRISSTRNIQRCGPSSAVYSSLTAHPDGGGMQQIAIGTCWWGGSFTGGSGGGSQGVLLVYNSGISSGSATDGQICAYNPLNNTWVFNKNSMAPFSYDGVNGTYHTIIEYSAVKNVAVYGGGNSAGRKVWRLNSDGTMTVMPDVPAGKEFGVSAGIMCADPVTGNFLLLSSGQLWQLDPSGAGSWTQQSGSRTPPAGVGVPGTHGVICCAIPEYGVVAYVTQTSKSGGTFFLYKHA